MWESPKSIHLAWDFNSERNWKEECMDGDSRVLEWEFAVGTIFEVRGRGRGGSNGDGAGESRLLASSGIVGSLGGRVCRSVLRWRWRVLALLGSSVERGGVVGHGRTVFFTDFIECGRGRCAWGVGDGVDGMDVDSRVFWVTVLEVIAVGGRLARGAIAYLRKHCLVRWSQTCGAGIYQDCMGRFTFARRVKAGEDAMIGNHLELLKSCLSPMDSRPGWTLPKSVQYSVAIRIVWGLFQLSSVAWRTGGSFAAAMLQSPLVTGALVAVGMHGYVFSVLCGLGPGRGFLHCLFFPERKSGRRAHFGDEQVIWGLEEAIRIINRNRALLTEKGWESFGRIGEDMEWCIVFVQRREGVNGGGWDWGSRGERGWEMFLEGKVEILLKAVECLGQKGAKKKEKGLVAKGSEGRLTWLDPGLVMRESALVIRAWVDGWGRICRGTISRDSVHDIICWPGKIGAILEGMIY
ncbi:hypothetical protein Tco_0848917 [Tanacetum coccineum]